MKDRKKKKKKEPKVNIQLMILEQLGIRLGKQITDTTDPSHRHMKEELRRDPRPEGRAKAATPPCESLSTRTGQDVLTGHRKQSHKEKTD